MAWEGRTGGLAEKDRCGTLGKEAVALCQCMSDRVHGPSASYGNGSASPLVISLLVQTLTLGSLSKHTHLKTKE